MQVQYFMKSGEIYTAEKKDSMSPRQLEAQLAEEVVHNPRVAVATSTGTRILDTRDILRIRVVD